MQNLQQIHSTYAPNKLETTELLSQITDQTTVVRKQTSTSGLRPGTRNQGQQTKSMQEIQRPPITADKATRLPSATKDEQGNVFKTGHLLTFVAGQAPIYNQQMLYFRDSVFQQRAQIPAPKTNDHINAGDY